MSAPGSMRHIASGRAVALLSVVVALAPPAMVSAHRLDEYLQASRIAIDRDRVEIEIDLTPGVAVARQVFSWIDSDHDGAISAAEADDYARLVVDSISLEVDDRRLPVDLLDHRLPTYEQMAAGVGTIRLMAAARLRPAPAGPHRIRYVNGHRPELSVYLVNALVPKSPDVRVTSQVRDLQQRETRIEYSVAPMFASWRTLAPFAMAAVMTALIVMRRRSITSGTRLARINV